MQYKTASTKDDVCGLDKDMWKSEEFMLGAMVWLAALTVIVIVFIIILIILSHMRRNRLFELETQVSSFCLLQTFLYMYDWNAVPEDVTSSNQSIINQ